MRSYVSSNHLAFNRKVRRLNRTIKCVDATSALTVKIPSDGGVSKHVLVFLQIGASASFNRYGASNAREHCSSFAKANLPGLRTTSDLLSA